jgi:Predicted RNA-binding protein
MAGDTSNSKEEAVPAGMQALKERALAFAQGVAEQSGLQMTARLSHEEPDGVTIAFEGAEARYMVGRNGQILDALAYLASLVVNRRGGPRLRVIFDADGYRAHREQTLRNLAKELSEQVLATGQEAVLDPLSPLERRIVHQALLEIPGVRTYSEGEDPERYVIISPAA